MVEPVFNNSSIINSQDLIRNHRIIKKGRNKTDTHDYFSSNEIMNPEPENTMKSKYLSSMVDKNAVSPDQNQVLETEPIHMENE